MALGVLLDGEDFFYATDYEVSEDATSVNPHDLNGGVGAITLTVSALENSRRAKGLSVHLADDTQGSTEGVIGSVSGSEDEYTLAIDTNLYLLTAHRFARPYNGTLGGLFDYYFSLVGIQNGFIVDSAIINKSVTVPGWEGIVWDKIKEVCVARHIEIAVVSDNIIVRPVRKFVANNDNELSTEWSTDNDNRAQSVDIMYYNNQFKSAGLIYPLDHDFISPRIETVDASATITVEYNLSVGSGEPGLGVSISTIDQPECITSSSIDYNGPSSYSVLDKRGKVVKAGTWKNGGGKVKVDISDDRSAITVSITGMRDVTRGPYTIAVPASSSQESLSSLVLWGSGVFYDKKVLTIPTGNTAVNSATESGGTIDNPFINTLGDAAIIGSWAAAALVDGGSSIQVSALNVNRTGPKENYNFPTILDFNLDNTGTVGEFNTLWAGKGAWDLNNHLISLVANEFDNQGFGNIAGARVYNEEAWYRIRTATINDEGVSYTADLDTTVGDFNAIWGADYVWTADHVQFVGETTPSVRTFNDIMAGVTVSDHAAYPLREGM